MSGERAQIGSYKMAAITIILISYTANTSCRVEQNHSLDNMDGIKAGLHKKVLELSTKDNEKRTLSSSEFHLYPIEMKSNQYVRVIIEEPETKLNVRLIDPSGQPLYEYTLRREGMLPVSTVAEQSGTVALVVWIADQQDISIKYTLRIDPIREATSQDRDSIRADEIFAEAERLRGEWQVDSFKQAVEKYKEAQSHWIAIGSSQNLAEVLLAKGELNAMLSENRQALEDFNHALNIARNIDHRQIETKALNNISAVYVELSDSNNIFKYSNLALTLSKETNNQQGEAIALNNIGLAYYISNDLENAAKSFNEALDICVAASNLKGKAQSLTNIGYTRQDLGNFREAQDYYKEALDICKAIGDPRGEAFALTACGNTYTFLGEKQKALSLHKDASKLFRQLGDLNGESAVLNGIGLVYEELGDKERALDAYVRSLELSRASGNREFQCLTMGYVGRMYNLLGQQQKALEYFNQRLQLSKEIGDDRIEAYTLSDIGTVFESIGSSAKARSYYDQALAISRRLQNRQGEAYILNYIGHLQDSLGNKRQALRNYNKALRLAKAVEDRGGEALTLYNLARVNRDLGDLKIAFAQTDDLLKIVESLRTKVMGGELRSSYLASVHQNYELCIDVLMRMHKRFPAKRFDVMALEISEKGRARTLLDMIVESHANIRQGVDPKLFDREQAVQYLINDKAGRRMELLNSNDKSQQLESIEHEIRSLTTQLQEIQYQIREQSPRYAALTQPVPLKVSEIQEQVLDEETILLEFSLGEETSYLWAVSKDSVKSYKLPARKKIEELSRKVYNALTFLLPLPKETPEQYDNRTAGKDLKYDSVAARLSQMLLGQVASEIINKRLLIVAEGALQYLPFSALPIPRAKGSSRPTPGLQINATPLIFEHEISNLPSASALALSRREVGGRTPARDAIAIFADPVFSNNDPRVDNSHPEQSPSPSANNLPVDLTRALNDAEIGNDIDRIPRLPSTRREAEAIVELAQGVDSLLALDFDANLAKVTSSDMREYRFIHMATHGIIDSSHPELSGIVFSLVDKQGNSQDGFLRMHDVYNLDLQADLIVLSACNTGIGKDIKGEGLIGLTRGFMYAGVPRVIASYWRVDDLATARLMRMFYRGLFKDKLMPAAALRDAQIEMWKSSQWKSPFYWAGFALQGEWR